MKLGKLAPKPHPKTLLMSRYLTANLPRPAARVFREYKVPAAAKLMYGNDSVGDCTCAAAADHIILTTVHTGTIGIPALADVISMYSAVSGYVDGDASTDNGAAMTDVLSHLQTTGLAGHKILGWAQIDHTNSLHRQLAVDLFGATYVGVQLPMNAQRQFANNQPWEAEDNDGGIEGGHCILRVGYGARGDNYVTWAKWDQKASTAWSDKYVDEEYIMVTESWINQATQKTPGGLNLAALMADLEALRV
jgi:hypothetical protein